jgi:hypothetical protein
MYRRLGKSVYFIPHPHIWQPGEWISTDLSQGRKTLIAPPPNPSLAKTVLIPSIYLRHFVVFFNA